VEIKILQNKDELRWDEFVKGNNSATLFHLISWKNVVEKTYGHRPIYLFIEENGNILGILPLFMINSRLFGKRLVSTPFSPVGGVCSTDKDASNSLINESQTIARDLIVSYMEFRGRSNDLDLPDDGTFVTSTLELNKSPEIVFNHLPQNKRRNITKSLKRGLVIEWTRTLKYFYPIYCQNMRNLGTPPHSYKFFDTILREFPDNSIILTVKLENAAIYSALFLFYKDTIVDFMSSSIEKYRKYYPTDFGIWNAITYACENGFKFIDFGRSIKDSPNHEFKLRWGAKTQQLYYNFYMVTAKKLPYLNPTNPRYNNLAKIWRRLPLIVTNNLGPCIRKCIV
jgi:FemAB-related protein (PEP-CTERM system-associated)